MPRGDGTGSEGLEPTAGRGAGYCSGSEKPGYANDEVLRQHLRRGFCGGRKRENGRGINRR